MNTFMDGIVGEKDEGACSAMLCDLRSAPPQPATPSLHLTPDSDRPEHLFKTSAAQVTAGFTPVST